MRRKESFYYGLQKDVKLFLKGLDNSNYFLLKEVAKTKAFKEFYKERQEYLSSPSLFSKKELKPQKIY